MGDEASLAKAKRELEDLYLGIPDESVNLTFQDLAQLKASPEKIRNPPLPVSPLQKLPSLDFNRGLQATRFNHHHHNVIDASSSHRTITPGKKVEFRQTVESGLAFDSVSVVSMASMYQEDKAQRRRPGIPHSNICTICSQYVYIFRHRCLVCGRVYCRDCVSVGMEEMDEGRKCIQCLGRRFSQRYIKRAGIVGCWSRYPSRVKQAELKWAEKGPRRSGERAYGARSPISAAPTRPLASGSNTNTPSFVASSTFSPYTPNHHHLPL